MGRLAHNGGATVSHTHCKHCGLPRTDDYWDDELDQHIPEGNRTYGDMPDDWEGDD